MDLSTFTIIAGPTASGKSLASYKLAKAFRAAIINCDARQVYRELPILTAQPAEAQVLGVPHFLYGCISVSDRYSVMHWLKDLEQLIFGATALRNENKFIITGGNAFYIKSLLEGLSCIPDVDQSIRVASEELLARVGPRGFFDILVSRDPKVLGLIKPTDSYRMLRAFEVIESTNISIVDYWESKGSKVGVRLDPADVVLHIIIPDKELLYRNISDRMDSMLQDGLLDEVGGLLSLKNNNVVNTTCGFKAFYDYLVHGGTLRAAIEEASRRTRRYAKSQYTWFRREFGGVAKSIYHSSSEELLSYYGVHG